MAEKRKDKNGTNLRAGESQRKDRTYQFRYTSPDGKTRYVYAKTLDKLREKELVIQRDLLDGIDYRGGEVSVSELVTRYMGTRRNFSKNTLKRSQFFLSLSKENPLVFGACTGLPMWFLTRAFATPLNKCNNVKWNPKQQTNKC